MYRPHLTFLAGVGTRLFRSLHNTPVSEPGREIGLFWIFSAGRGIEHGGRVYSELMPRIYVTRLVANPPLKTKRTRPRDVYVVKFLCIGAAAARRLERLAKGLVNVRRYNGNQ